jgi:hypothetical protein
MGASSLGARSLWNQVAKVTFAPQWYWRQLPWPPLPAPIPSKSSGKPGCPPQSGFFLAALSSSQWRTIMDNTTLLIIVLVILVLLGGGYVGRGRWW